MAIHCSRDLITVTGGYYPVVSMYFQAIFLRTVLNFSIVGNTGFALDSGTYTLGSGTTGVLSASDGFTNRFTPNGYTVSVSDVNRILVIRSTNNPMLTSGLWRVTGVDVTNNQFILGLRGEPPIAESNLTWRLHPAENTLSWPNGTNGLTGQYRGRTSASSTSRIIMQSPHASAWQVRLTYETSSDVNSALTVRQKATFAPGVGGDTIGDFPVGGQHLHGALFFNTSTVNYCGTVVGFCPKDTTGGLIRYYIWGDDQTGTLIMMTRSVNDTTTNNWCAFGLPENEQYPDDTQIVRRLFAFGVHNIYNNGINDITWACGSAQQYGRCVVGFGYSGQPIMGGVSTLCYHSGQQNSNNGPRWSGNGGDNPFLAATELQTADIMLGTWDYGDFNGQNPTLLTEPRRLGTFPIARLGRANYDDWSTSTDGNRTWIHTLNGVYLPWQGSILP